MKTKGTLVIEVLCSGLRTFNRNKGGIGQEFLTLTDSGYQIRIPAPDQQILDLSSCVVGQVYSFEVEPIVFFTNDVTKDNRVIGKNIIGLKIKNKL